MKKNLFSYFLIALFSLFIFSCNKDEDPVMVQQGEVEFGFSVKAIANTSNKSAKAVAAEPVALIISIKDASGTLVNDTERIELYNMNGYYISKPLSLLVGNYTLVKFMVVDVAGNVIYASPIEGSELAYLVNDPLPINFSLNKDEVLKLMPEVLSTENVTPEDFGYTTFSFEVVETFDFLLSVFVYNETVQNFELTDAMLSISAEGNSIYLDTLAAITNQIKVNDGFDSYILTVTKEGYTSNVDTFNNAELKLYFKSEDNGPLIVTLINTEKITLTTDQITPSQFYLQLGWNSGTQIIVNWGDNNFETIDISASTSRNYYHDYTVPGIYNIEITGHIKNVIRINTPNQQVISVDLTNASGLEELEISQSPLNNIDISHNSLLYRLDLYMNNLLELDVSNNPKLRFLNCSKNNISSINLIENNNLETLSISSNNFTELDVTNCHSLTMLTIDYNNITTIDLSNNLELTFFNCTENLGLSNIDITNNINLASLHFSYNPQLRYVEISNNSNLTTIGCVRNTMTSEEVNTLLIDLLDNVQTNPRNGEINTIINSVPTGEGLNAKNTLINTYGWNVITD